jgi:hypothetical protein
MKASRWMQLAALVSTFGLAGSAVAADAATSTAQMQNGGPSPGGSVQGYIPPGPASVGGTERVDNSNGVPLTDPARTYAQENGGHLPPTVIVDAEGNAWDVVGVEPSDASDADSTQLIFLRPHGERAAVVTPDNDRTVYAAPDSNETLYVAPDADRTMHWLPNDENPGGTQAMPGYMGPASDKGQ